ncbi:SpaA isopeptide-forming pilin-related protein [Dysosmobacter sp.]|uniref:SpaA isopeptide-forming pilin-related protein n=1 Tax=Dysosmobacter sp. TaxID=2591382 RepID=UPI003A94EA0C
MKAFKHMTALVLALVMAAALAVTAYAASVTVKYRVYVYSDEITFRQYDYSQSTTPSITNLTISATSGLGSGSALYHMKYADGAVAYCIEPGVHSDDSGTYKEGSSASWYNLPASVQSGIALAMSLGYPSADYGAASGDRNSSAIINAEKWAATQAIELKRNAAGSYTATVTDDNEVLSAYNFAANSGSGITFTRKGNTLTITATAAAAKNLDTEKTYSATGSAYEIDPDRAVICWYDRTGRYQAMAGYTGVGRDPVKAYIKIKAVEEKGSITVRKVDATGAPLAGAELLLETSADGQAWTEVGKITTDSTGVAKWENLKTGVQYRVTETKAPAGYTLLTEPLFTGVLDSRPIIILTRTFVLDLANSAWAAFSLSCSSVCRYSRSTWLTLMVGYPWIRLPIMTLSFSSAIV